MYAYLFLARFSFSPVCSRSFPGSVFQSTAEVSDESTDKSFQLVSLIEN
jgi:hypothetical protein